MKRKNLDSNFEKTVEEVINGKINYPTYLIAGPGPITTPICSRLAKAILLNSGSDTNLARFNGDTMSENSVMEFILTKGLFSRGKKVVWIQDAPFLEESTTLKSRWKHLSTSLERGDAEKIFRQLANILNDLAVPAETFINSSTQEAIEQCKIPSDFRIDDLMNLIKKHETDFLEKASSLRENRGKIIEWLQEDQHDNVSIIFQSENPNLKCGGFKIVSSKGPVFDFRLAGKGKKANAEAVNKITYWLRQENLSIDRNAAELLVSLTGTGDMAKLKSETDKLAAMCSNKSKISFNDVKKLTGRSREEELYKLTEAITERNLPKALGSLHIIIRQETSPVAILSSIANTIRKLITLKAAIIAGPGIEKVKRASSREFENIILPELKRYYENYEETEYVHNYKNPLEIHPFALFMSSRKIHLYSMEELLYLLSITSEFDIAMKGESSSPEEFLDYVIFKIIIGTGEKEQ